MSICNNNPNILCVAGSSFQLLSLLGLFSDPAYIGHNKCDLLIIGQFDDARQYATKIEKEKVFTSVHCADPHFPFFRHLGTHYLIDVLFGREKYSKQLVNAFPEVSSRNYDILFCSFPDRAALEAKHLYVANGSTCFFDDGTASHSGEVFKLLSCYDDKTLEIWLARSRKERLKNIVKRFACQILPQSAKFNIDSLFIFGANEGPTTDLGKIAVRNIPNPPRDLIVRVFLDEADVRQYKKNSAIYLTLPDNVSEKSKEIERRIILLLEELTDNKVFIKLHPRRNMADFSWISDLLLPRSMWEAVLFEGAVGRHTILISPCSTAQTSPKLFIGLEPYLVFTYQLFPSNDLPFSSFSTIVSEITHAYSDKTKVIDITRMEQFQLIANIINHHNQ